MVHKTQDENKPYRILKGQSTMDSAEKLPTQGTPDENNKAKTEYKTTQYTKETQITLIMSLVSY